MILKQFYEDIRVGNGVAPMFLTWALGTSYFDSRQHANIIDLSIGSSNQAESYLDTGIIEPISTLSRINRTTRRLYGQNVVFEIAITYSNNSEESVTIREIALIYQRGSDNFYDEDYNSWNNIVNRCASRKVLDTPITIAPGESKAVVGRFCCNPNSQGLLRTFYDSLVYQRATDINNTIQTVVDNNSVWGVYPERCPFGKTWVGDDSWMLRIGCGNTPVTPTDYKLDQPNTGLTRTSMFSSRQNWDDEKLFTAITATFVNNTVQDVVVREMGLFWRVTRPDHTFLMAREVLDEPKTIEPGESATFEMKIKFL